MNYPLLGVGVLVVVAGVAYATYGGDEKSAVPSVGRASENRSVTETDGTRHSIPLGEILDGGPGKDGIPSIDEPKFESAHKATSFLNDEDPGIGLIVNGEARFYPYRILVWHEIVNDSIQGTPVLVTYCPLCATGIVFDRRVDGVAEEFGVSGKLWQSNLLMYNRAVNEKNESLWSQVLGEAVVGVHTEKTLAVIPSDIMRWGEWKKLHPDTKALSSDTGTSRNYGRDPYGDYYTSESIMFGSQFRDTRLHPKALILGIRIGETYKAYPLDKIPEGASADVFDKKIITIERTGEVVRFRDGDTNLSSVPAFWFSWLAVHPDTKLFVGREE